MAFSSPVSGNEQMYRLLAKIDRQLSSLNRTYVKPVLSGLRCTLTIPIIPSRIWAFTLVLS